MPAPAVCWAQWDVWGGQVDLCKYENTILQGACRLLSRQRRAWEMLHCEDGGLQSNGNHQAKCPC